MVNVSEIERLAEQCGQAYGSRFIAAPQVAHGGITHAALVALARAAGVVDPSSASMVHLVNLYSVARKNPTSAAQVAERINKAAGLTPAPSAPPTAPSPAPSLSAAWVEALVEQEVGGLRQDMERRVSVTAETLHDRITEVSASIAEYAQGKVDEAVAAFKANEPVRLVLEPLGAPPVHIGLVHYMTPRIIRALHAGLNVYLHGPAGSGKTTAARQAAEALGVAFYFAAKVESEYLLLGFKDAHGETVRTQFREAYEHGGVFLFDEMDASASGAIVAINAALANGHCPFPDGVVQRHADFYCIGAGNTVLTGANRQYAGRVQLDAASIDRFYFLEFGYDDALEMELASNKGWCLHVQAIRKAVAERGLSHLVTPRATFDGCKALEAGETWEEAENGAIFKGLDTATIEQLRNATNLFASNQAA